MGRLRSLLIPGVDKRLLVKDAVKAMPDPARRRFIAGGASLGALTLLTGCDVTDSFSADSLLARISKFNDAVQATIFNPYALAPTFPESAITKPFPFNAYYGIDDAPEVNGKEWKLEVRGLVDNKKSWTLEELYKLPQVKQITRHICVEGWSAIGSWTGTPLRDFLKLIGADTRAKYCWFQCADSEGYNSPLDMETALHPQTQMTF
jgi:DMSO/TMAO reductase YedYZ molybdopterin-dependent catalytic subunit